MADKDEPDYVHGVGYFNHCSVCGFAAGIHATDGTIIGGPNVGGEGVQPHKFERVMSEGMRASEAPSWDDFEELRERVENAEGIIEGLQSRWDGT